MMDVDTKENTLTTKNMEEEYSHGQMVGNTMDNGKMENKMAMECISMSKVKQDMAGGKMENGNNGFNRKIMIKASIILITDESIKISFSYLKNFKL